MKYQVIHKSKRCLIVDIDRNSYANSWLDLMQMPEEDIEMITNWVHTNKFGRRTAWNEWTLNSDQAVTTFVLTWHQREM